MSFACWCLLQTHDIRLQLSALEQRIQRLRIARERHATHDRLFCAVAEHL